MSSFTDSIASYNPYIQTLPVEQYVSVGMMKQQQYEQGIQKIQGQIDTIGSLPIAHPEVQKYLGAKLGQMRGELNKNLGADFSDSRLVNQVGGLARKISSDPIIQNGVQSTMNYKKALTDIETAKKEGKGAYSIANEWDVMSKANNWLNNKDVTSSFNDKYTPYIDQNKKNLEILKALGANGKIDQIPFYVSPDGKIDYEQIAGAMQERGIEGIDATRIRNAMSAMLTPDDLNQMSIDGRYQFRNYAPEDMVRVSEGKYQTKIRETKSDIDKLQKYAELNKSNASVYNKTKESIAYLKRQIGDDGRKGEAEIQHEDELSFLRNNPDEAKAQIYKNGYLDQFSNAFSWEKTTLKYLDNPITKQGNWEKEYALSKSRFNLEGARFSWDKVMDKANLTLAQDTNKRGWAELAHKKEVDLMGEGTGFQVYLGGDAEVSSPSTAMQNDIEGKLQASKALVKQIADGTGAKPEWVEKQLEKYQETGESEIPVAWSGQVNQIMDNRSGAKYAAAVLDDVRKKVMLRPEIANANASIDEQLKGRAPLKLYFGGKQYSFSPREIVDFLNKEKRSPSSTRPGSTKSHSIPIAMTIDPSTLNSKEKALYKQLETSRYGSYSVDRNKDFSKKVNAILDTYEPYITTSKDNLMAVNKAVETELLTSNNKWVPRVVNFDTPTPAVRNKIEGIVGDLLLKTEHDSGGNLGLDKDVVNEWLTDKTDKANLQYKVFIQGDDTELWVKNGEKLQRLKMNREEAIQIPGVKYPVNLEAQDRTRNKTGNSNLTDDPVNALYQRYRFGNVKNLNVNLDIQKNMSSPGMIYPKLNLKTPVAWRSVELSKLPLDYETIDKFVAALTDEQVKQIFIENLPSLKDEINSIK